jgi:hypothetical protein
VGSSPTSPTTKILIFTLTYFDTVTTIFMTKKTSQERTAERGYRRKRLPKYQSFRLSRRIKPENIRVLPSFRSLVGDTLSFLRIHWVMMLTFTAVYGLVYFVLVKAASGFELDVAKLNQDARIIFDGNWSGLLSFFTVYSSLVSSIGVTKDDLTNFVQALLTIVSSLAFIWMIRKLHSKDKEVTVRQAFYMGMQPLVPFILVICIFVLELIPASIGLFVLSTAQTAGIIASQAELQSVSLVAGLLIVLSLYLLTGSIFALYIVTLPGTYPVVAVRSSLNLLRVHRWQVVWRLLAFVLLVLVLGFVLTIPAIVWLPKYAEVWFFILGCSSFGVLHTYTYKLYRSMIG